MFERGRSKYLPRVVEGRDKKDLATPRTADSTLRLRLRKRARRASESPRELSARASTSAFPWNLGCKAKASQTCPQDAQQRWMWNILRRSEWPEPPPSMVGEGRKPCAVCEAPVSKWCICGADFAHRTRNRFL